MSHSRTAARSTGAPRGAICHTRRPDARVRLYAFPHTAGSPGEFIRWGEHLPGAEVWGIQLPGRGERIGEQALTSMDDVVADVLARVGFGEPFVFFGHSLGALVAYETAYALAAKGGPEPSGIVVSACPAPSRLPPRDDPAALGDAELLAFIEDRYGALPDQMRGNQKLLELVLPTWRCDLTVYARYRPVAPQLQNVPMLILGGADDDISGTELAAWRAHTTAGADLAVLPGHHFYFRDQVPRVAAQIGAFAERAVPPPGR